MTDLSFLTVNEVIKKLEYFCSYQDRCHADVISKLFEFNLTQDEKDTVIVHLIENDLLNEERFVLLFAISKLHQKKWGKIRITQELKLRKVSSFLILKALKSLPDAEYDETFEILSEKCWDTITENNKLKKQKKFCDYLLRKGWESNLVYSRYKEFSAKKS